MPGLFGGFGNYFAPIFQGSPEVVYPRVNNLSFISSPNPFFNLRVWRWNRMDIISTIKHFFHEFITFKYRKSYLWIINLGYILMSHISQLLGNNSKSEILLSDIKDYAIIPLVSLDYSSNAFINITNLIRSSSNGHNNNFWNFTKNNLW